MELARFQALVGRLERHAARHPLRYRWEVWALALLGYLYLAVVALLLLGLFAVAAAAAIASKNGILVVWAVTPVLVLGAIARSLAVRFERPTGIEVSMATVPALARVIEEIRLRCGGPPVHRLLFTTDLNAMVVQHPRLGILGWYENHLVLGVPLVVTLPSDEFRCILAHEFGHLAGNHGRMGAWIHRQRSIYSRLEAALAQQPNRLARWVLAPLYRWYFPYFNACSFALVRQQEFDADQLAAALVSAVTAQRAMSRMQVIQRWRNERLGPDLARAADAGEPPPSDIYHGYAGRLRAQVDGRQAATWVQEALQVPTDYHDSHPSFRDRIAALAPDGRPAPPELDLDLAGDTALTLLGGQGDAILREAGRRWREAALPGWEQQRQRTVEARARWEALAAKAAAEGLSPQERWTQVGLAEQLEGLRASAALAGKLAAEDPKLYGARFVLARARLGDGDEGGLAEMEVIARESPASIMAVGNAAFAYLWSRGRTEEAERWRQMLVARQQELDAAAAERARYPVDMPLVPHGLAPEVVAPLRAYLAGRRDVRVAYLVQRVVRHAPEFPCYIVGVIPRTPWWKLERLPAIKALTADLARAIAWPEGTTILPLVMELKPLRKRMRRSPGAILVEG